MSSSIHKSGNHTVGKCSFLTLEGRKTTSLDLMLQGKLDAWISSPEKGYPLSYEDLRKKSYRLFDMYQNIFIGVNDLLLDSNNSLTVTAATDCSIYSFDADGSGTALDIIRNQKDYGSYVINSLCNLIDSTYKAYKKASSYCHTVESLYNNLCIYYMSLACEYGLEPVSGAISDSGANGLASLKKNNVQVPLYFSKQFIEAEFSEILLDSSETSESEEDTEYFTHLFNVPTELKKTFFAADWYITRRHIIDAAGCLDIILKKLRRVLSRLEEAFDRLYRNSEESIYKSLMKAADDMNAGGLDYTPAMNAASYIYEKLKDISAYIELEYKHSIGIDFEYLEHSHKNFFESIKGKTLKAAGDNITNEGSVNNQCLPDELTDSAEKILRYSEISEDKAICFMMNLTAFRNLKDRLSGDETARTVRGALTELYFELYPLVFAKSHQAQDSSRLIRMFLSYGYMDEKLLDHDQIMAIYRLAGMEHADGKIKVYFMHEWLEAIYKMEKEPSVNNLGHDYHDTFRELKKHGRLTDSDKAAYDRDAEGRLSFELNNMFRLTHKMCHGQIALYFPILHRDMAPANPFRAHTAPDIIREKLNNILEIDYSAFHREIHYKDPSGAVEKEIVMMQVMPDIILVPVYGTRAIMWQEITGRLRNSPGRLLLPVFTDESLDDMLIKLVGNFRWELCRTMMGSAWNDISEISLTSEYTDYIQFYRKNRDLTDDAKERVKSLTVKYHNRLRDIFTADYELWINNESKGNPRLNKVARGIFSRHCPLSKDIRAQLERQPIYSDLIGITKLQRQKQARELENRYKNYIKANGVLDPVLQENLEFYRDK